MYSAADLIWTLLGTVLVFFMQAGFAMVETGFTRAKNAGNIVMKNLMDYVLGSLAFWVIGFGILMGKSHGGVFGTLDLFVKNDYSTQLPTFVVLIFYTVFCATSATIVSGAMAGRTKFIAYVIYSLVISAFVFPVSAHWIWNPEGWLKALGFHDFAGSTAVHFVGGLTALIGAKLLGARIGKYGKDGKSHAIPGHSITLGALGVFILWFGWFGFNGGSTMSVTGDETLLKIGGIFVATNLSAAAAAATAMTITWVRYGKPDITMTLNGVLAGLVAVTAGCDQVSPVGAAVIGITAGFVVVYGIEIIDNVFKIDDPVGAVSVHGLCGALGTLMTGLFSTTQGAFYVKGGWHFFGVQALGVGAVGLYIAVVMTVIFKLIDATVGLRVSAETEIAGLDIKEHGLMNGYADFMLTKGSMGVSGMESPVLEIDSAEEELDVSKYQADGKIRKVVVVMNQNRFESLKAALDKIDITGMTVTYVSGCGIQKGATEYYRGSTYESHLLPKVKVEIVISTVPLDLLIDTIKKSIFTGRIGDGKIFVYDVANVIKVRTNEEGRAALE